MKKLVSILTVIAVLTLGVFATASCKKDAVKNGSKITEMTITFSVNGQKKEVNFELFENYAPETIAHFKYLVEKGYYDGSVISNCSDFLEFGAYKGERFDLTDLYASETENGYYDLITDGYVDGKTMGGLSKYTEDKSIRGEFYNNGYRLDTNSTLSLDGALVLKRDLSDDNSKNYDTGKATVVATFGSNAYVDSARNFAVFAKVKTDDGSYDVLKSILVDNETDDDENLLFYYKGELESVEDDFDREGYLSELEEVGRYITLSSSNTYYAQDSDGNFTIDLSLAHSDLLDKIIADVSNDTNVLLCLPATEIKIVSISISSSYVKE